VLFVSTLGISPVPDRQIYDMVTCISLLSTILIGVYLHKSYLSYGIIFIIFISVIPNIYHWFDYRSAVLNIDRYAIEYVNKLDINEYSVSSQINPLIYKQFIGKEYVDYQAEVIIMRNKPMTPCSDINSKAYVKHGVSSIQLTPKITIFNNLQVQPTIITHSRINVVVNN